MRALNFAAVQRLPIRFRVRELPVDGASDAVSQISPVADVAKRMRTWCYQPDRGRHGCLRATVRSRVAAISDQPARGKAQSCWSAKPIAISAQSRRHAQATAQGQRKRNGKRKTHHPLARPRAARVRPCAAKKAHRSAQTTSWPSLDEAVEFALQLTGGHAGLGAGGCLCRNNDAATSNTDNVTSDNGSGNILPADHRGSPARSHREEMRRDPNVFLIR